MPVLSSTTPFALARRMRLYWLAFKLAFAARKCDKYKIPKNYSKLYPPTHTHKKKTNNNKNK